MPKVHNVLPKLVCLVTGKKRTSNIKYLKAKADRLGLEVEKLQTYYVCREAIRELRKGLNFDQIREKIGSELHRPTGFDEIEVKELLRINAKGKHKKEVV
jgi:hypothetical protein